jgi:signal transduction histidine kinase
LDTGSDDPVNPRFRRAGRRFGLPRGRTTVRWRLTLLYGGLFLASGAALLAITYTLVEHATVSGPDAQASFVPTRVDSRLLRLPKGPPNVHLRSPVGASPALLEGVRRLIQTRAGRATIAIAGSGQRIADLHQLEVESVIALAIMAVISAALGWVVAGRVLRPLRTMTATAQQITEVNLHQRLAMPGPRDELRELGDTIDGLLERLEEAFDAQRRFVANASHELRTPLTAARALLEMILSDPHATVQTFRQTCAEVLEEGEQQEQLIDALLALAHGQRGIDPGEPLDLAAIAGEALGFHGPEAAARDLGLAVSLDPALMFGDRRLIERLVSNLLDNAIRHNTPDGLVQVRVRTEAGQASLAVANTGPFIPAEEIGRLLQPFQRLAADRVSQRDGFGLGLSIVAAIAGAHDATLDVRPGPDGGLGIEVRFPAPPGSVRFGSIVADPGQRGLDVWSDVERAEQAGDLEDLQDARSQAGHHQTLPRYEPPFVVDADQDAKGGRVDEVHLREIEHKPPAARGERFIQLLLELRGRRDVQLPLDSEHASPAVEVVPSNRE